MSGYKNLLLRAAELRCLADEFCEGPAHYTIAVTAWNLADLAENEAFTIATNAARKGRSQWIRGRTYWYGSCAGRSICLHDDGSLLGLEDLVPRQADAIAPARRRKLLIECLAASGGTAREFQGWSEWVADGWPFALALSRSDKNARDLRWQGYTWDQRHCLDYASLGA